MGPFRYGLNHHILPARDLVSRLLRRASDSPGLEFFVDGKEISMARGAVASVVVRRNEKSSSLAMEVARELVLKFGGSISWDGMHYWEGLYRRTYADRVCPDKDKA